MTKSLKEFRRTAEKMHARALALGLTTKSGSPVVIDLMEELLAANMGFRNAHAARAHLSKGGPMEPPALEQENPHESGSDYVLVNGRSCWLTMGVFSVNPYLTDEGIVVDVFANGAESEAIGSTWALFSDAEEELVSDLDIDVDEAEAWARSQGCKHFDALPSTERTNWLWKFSEAKSAEALQAREDALTDIGYTIQEDSDQPGLWVWMAPTDGCDSSFSSRAEAVRAAWTDASEQAMRLHSLSNEDWAALSSKDQLTLVKGLLTD